MPLRILMTLLTGVSFLGLCAWIKDRLEIDDTGAPLVASGCVIVVLMLSGMARILLWGWLSLLIGGLAAFVWAFIIRRVRLSIPLLAALLVLTPYIWLHYRGTYFDDYDTVSHWAIAAKFLLRENHFPTASTELIHFPSYPLGTAVFIYYFCRTAGMGAGPYLAAQGMLVVFSLLPVLGHARKNRWLSLPFAAIVFIALFLLNRFHYGLEVDALLAQMALGGTCVLLQNTGERPGRTTAAILPVVLALTYIKAAGIFFSVLLCVFQYILLRRARAKAAGQTLLFMLLAVAAAFALWQLHFKLSYGNGFAGNHAVSAARYSSNLSGKSTSLMTGVAVRMITRLFHRKRHFLCAGVCAATFALAMFSGPDRGKWFAAWRRSALLSLSVYALWYLMLYAMYILSMTVGEAASLASIERYEDTAVIYFVGVLLVYAVRWLSARAWDLSFLQKGAVLCALFALLGSFLSFTGSGRYLLQRLFDQTLDGREFYSYMLDIRKKNAIEEGKRYLYYVSYSRPRHEDAGHIFPRITKYEFYSNEMMGIFHGENLVEEGGETDYGYRLNLHFAEREVGFFDDIQAFLAEHIDEYDYLLVYDYDADFDAALKDFLKDYTGDTQVCYSY